MYSQEKRLEIRLMKANVVKKKRKKKELVWRTLHEIIKILFRIYTSPLMIYLFKYQTKNCRYIWAARFSHSSFIKFNIIYMALFPPLQHILFVINQSLNPRKIHEPHCLVPPIQIFLKWYTCPLLNHPHFFCVSNSRCNFHSGF